MINFKQYFLLEKDMSIDSALNIFGLTYNDLGDQKTVKDRFRELSLKHHPDRGGTKEKQQEINLAWEVLKRADKAKSTTRTDWDAIHKKYRQMGEIIQKRLVDNFDIRAYLKHFAKFSETQLGFQYTRLWPLVTDRSPSFAGFKGEFSDKERDTIFTIEVTASLHDVVNSNALSFDDLDMKVSIIAIGFFSGKEQKLSKSNWKFTSDHKFMKDPEKIFPSAKLKKIFSGSTSKRKFQKRDMIAFLTKKLKGSWDGDYARIPIGINENDPKGYFTLTIYRITFDRIASWGINGIYDRFKRASGPFAIIMPETEESAKMIASWIKASKRVKDPKKIINIIKHDEDRMKREREKRVSVKA